MVSSAIRITIVCLAWWGLRVEHAGPEIDCDAGQGAIVVGEVGPCAAVAEEGQAEGEEPRWRLQARPPPRHL